MALLIIFFDDTHGLTKGPTFLSSHPLTMPHRWVFMRPTSSPRVAGELRGVGFDLQELLVSVLRG